MPEKLNCRWRPALVLLAVLFGNASTYAETARTFAELRTDDAHISYQNGVPIAVLSGSPEDIGRQHAALMAAPARQVLNFPKKLAAAIGMEPAWPLVVGAGRALMLNAPERHRQEMTAICNHGDLDYGDIAAGNAMLELRRMGCSTLVVEPDKSATGGPLFGRNFDFPTLGELDKYSVLLVYRPTGRHAFASVAFPGAVGVFSGMNDAGLAVATLDVESSADGSRKFDLAGTPLALVFRRILEECTTVDEAERLLRSVRATTWTNLVVCDRVGGAVFEITPANVARRGATRGVLPCTNHFRTEGLVKDIKCWRYPLLVAAQDEGKLDVEAVRQHLDEVSFDKLTMQTMVFEPRTLMLHLALGEPPTSDDELAAVELRPLFEGVSSEAPAAAGR